MPDVLGRLFQTWDPSVRLKPENLGFYCRSGGPEDTEIKVHSFENPEMTTFNVLSINSRVGQNIALHASPTARNVFLVLISTFPVHSLSFSL